jgi:hypothetical protein
MLPAPPAAFSLQSREPLREVALRKLRSINSIQGLFSSRGYYAEYQHARALPPRQCIELVHIIAKKQYLQLMDPDERSRWLSVYARLLPDFAAVDEFYLREIHLAEHSKATNGTAEIPKFWHQLQKKGSLSQQEAADFFCVSRRMIRNYLEEKKLTGSKKGRVACDEKLRNELRKVHGNHVLQVPR